MPYHEARCRELAECRVQSGWAEDVPADAGGRLHLRGPSEGIIETERGLELAYDPRFASLRGRHSLYVLMGEASYSLDVSHDEASEDCSTCADARKPYCLRMDGDALDEAIAACGIVEYKVLRLGEKVAVVFPTSDGQTWAEALNHAGVGATFREAASAALWQAEFGHE
jgi:hypothetical protein